MQFLGERAIENNLVAVPGEFQSAAVQEKSVQAELFFDIAIECEISVTGIAQERVPDACEVGANLVHAACFELDFYEVVAFVMLLDAVVGPPSGRPCRFRRLSFWIPWLHRCG